MARLRREALYLKVLNDTRVERLTLILLANSDGLQRETRFDEAGDRAITLYHRFPRRVSRAHDHT